LLVTGIAEPKPLITHLESHGIEVEPLQFSDHHDFTATDMHQINSRFNAIEGSQKIILTTEKDAVRLKHNENYPESLIDNVFYLPISVEIMGGGEKDFENKLLKHVKQD
jgi:tetraacyldisaccharide 4'-kinase